MRTLILGAAAMLALAGGLSACQQNTSDDEPARAAEASGTDTDVTIRPPDNVTVVQPDTPDVNIDPPDVNINPPDVDVTPPGETTTKESTTVTIPGVGSQTTTVERK